MKVATIQLGEVNRSAVQKYNGGGNPSYVNDVFKYFNSVQSATRSNYVTK